MSYEEPNKDMVVNALNDLRNLPINDITDNPINDPNRLRFMSEADQTIVRAAEELLKEYIWSTYNFGIEINSSSVQELNQLGFVTTITENPTEDPIVTIQIDSDTRHDLFLKI